MRTLDNLYLRFSNYSDSDFFNILIESINDQSIELPGFPSKTFQEIIVGKSNEIALKEAFDFYMFIKKKIGVISPSNKILDFGVGWGRIIRFFIKDIYEVNLFGVDVDLEVLKEARRLNVPGNLLCIEPNGSLPFPNHQFEVIYAFSVFSHLSEKSAKHWLHEIMRVLKPSGTFVFTTTTEWFLNLCLACKLKVDNKNEYEKIYSALFDDPYEAIENYRQGEHVYSPSGGNAKILDGINYGWASIPPKYIEREIGPLSEMIDFIDDKSLCEQGIFTVRKRETPKIGQSSKYIEK